MPSKKPPQQRETPAVELLRSLDLDLPLPSEALVLDAVVIVRYLDGDDTELAVGSNASIDWLTRWAMVAYAYEGLER